MASPIWPRAKKPGTLSCARLDVCQSLGLVRAVLGGRRRRIRPRLGSGGSMVDRRLVFTQRLQIVDRDIERFLVVFVHLEDWPIRIADIVVDLFFFLVGIEILALRLKF